MNRILLLLLAGGLAGCAALPTTGQVDGAGHARRRTPVVAVFQQCRDAVVNISTTRVVQMGSLGGSVFDRFFDLRRPARQRVESVGSGVVVHESGYIVTNAHVVAQASDVQVTFANDESLPAEVVAVDSEHDLAILKVDAPRPLAFAKLGRSDDIMIGETVVAIGNPLGLQHTVTAGIVSAINRDLQLSSESVQTDLIQTDAPINPGNSGGPLLNLNAELIGINTAIRGDAQNIGFAIPVDRLWQLLPAMLDIERRQRVRFGMRVSGADAEVIGLLDGSPAAKAGAELGDRVVSFNGEKVRDGIDYYVRLLGQKPGSSVKLTVSRAGASRTIEVPMEAIPPPDGKQLAARLLGVDLGEISDQLQRRHDLPEYARLIVTEVERGGPADRARMQVGDLILRLDRVPVRRLEEVGLALEHVLPGHRVTVQGLRLDADPAFFWTVTIPTRVGR